MKTTIDLSRLSTNERLRELSDIRGSVMSDSQKVEAYLYFIAEEFTLLNSERRENYARNYIKKY